MADESGRPAPITGARETGAGLRRLPNPAGNVDTDLLTRPELEALIASDVRTLGADTDRIGRMFASTHDVSNNDMDALLHIVVSEAAGTPLSAGELAQRLRISGPAVTYLVDRMIQAGHIQRETHHSDRRKVVLRYSENGLRVAQLFFEPLREHNRTAMAHLADQDLAAAHRVLTALSGAINAYRAELDRPAIT